MLYEETWHYYDIPSIPLDEDDEAKLDDGARQGDGLRARGGSVATNCED